MNVGIIRQIVDRVNDWFEFIWGSDASNEDAAVGSYKYETGQTPDASEKANCQLSIARHWLIGKTTYNQNDLSHSLSWALWNELTLNNDESKNEIKGPNKSIRFE